MKLSRKNAHVSAYITCKIEMSPSDNSKFGNAYPLRLKKMSN
jgi:hypothetical protein